MAVTQEHDEKKRARRFKAQNYLERYTTVFSPDFTERVRELFSLFEDYRRNRKDAKWASCCNCFERLGLKENLGHDPEKMVPVSVLATHEGIETESDLERFLLKKLLRDDGRLLLPQVNMRHPADMDVVQPNVSFLETTMDELEAERPVFVSDEVTELQAQVNDMRTELNTEKELNRAYREEVSRLDGKVDKADGTYVAILLKVQEVLNDNEKLKADVARLTLDSELATSTSKRVLNWALEIEDALLKIPVQLYESPPGTMFPVYPLTDVALVKVQDAKSLCENIKREYSKLKKRPPIRL